MLPSGTIKNVVMGKVVNAGVAVSGDFLTASNHITSFDLEKDDGEVIHFSFDLSTYAHINASEAAPENVSYNVIGLSDRGTVYVSGGDYVIPGVLQNGHKFGRVRTMGFKLLDLVKPLLPEGTFVGEINFGALFAKTLESVSEGSEQPKRQYQAGSFHAEQEYEESKESTPSTEDQDIKDQFVVEGRPKFEHKIDLLGKMIDIEEQEFFDSPTEEELELGIEEFLSMSRISDRLDEVNRAIKQDVKQTLIDVWKETIHYQTKNLGETQDDTEKLIIDLKDKVTSVVDEFTSGGTKFITSKSIRKSALLDIWASVYGDLLESQTLRVNGAMFKMHLIKNLGSINKLIDESPAKHVGKMIEQLTQVVGCIASGVSMEEDDENVKALTYRFLSSVIEYRISDRVEDTCFKQNLSKNIIRSIAILSEPEKTYELDPSTLPTPHMFIPTAAKVSEEDPCTYILDNTPISNLTMSFNMGRSCTEGGVNTKAILNEESISLSCVKSICISHVYGDKTTDIFYSDKDIKVAGLTYEDRQSLGELSQGLMSMLKKLEDSTEHYEKMLYNFIDTYTQVLNENNIYELDYCRRRALITVSDYVLSTLVDGCISWHRDMVRQIRDHLKMLEVII